MVPAICMSRKSMLKCMLGLFVICAYLFSYGHTQAATGVCTDGLVAYWNFNTGAQDFSNNGRNGTLVGQTNFATGGINLSGALFDGAGDGITVTDHNSLDFTTGLTMEMWIFSQDTNAGFPLNKIGTGNFGKYSIYRANAADAAYGCYLNEAVVGLSLLATQVDNNEWFHLVCTYDGSQFKMFKD